MKHQALHDLSLTCSLDTAFPRPPSLQHLIQSSSIAFLEGLPAPSHSSQCHSPHDPKYNIMFTLLPPTPDSRFPIGKDQLTFVYTSPGLCTIIGTQEYILKKIKELQKVGPIHLHICLFCQSHLSQRPRNSQSSGV